ncbi:MAG: hypothetical protein ACK50A_11245 [Sphingobacteriaceae bacterium]
MNNFLEWFPTNPICNGYTKDIIIDFQRGKIYNIPNSFSQVVKSLMRYGRKVTEEKYKNNRDVLKEYYDFIVKNEFGRFYKKLGHTGIISLNDSFESPSLINILIIESLVLENKYLLDFTKTFKVKYVLIKLNYAEINYLKKINELIENSNILCFEIIITGDFNKEIIKKLALLSKKIVKIFAYNSKTTKLINLGSCLVYMINEKYEYFLNTNFSSPIINIDLQTYIESKNYNVYLNNKVYINNKQYIFNTEEDNEPIAKLNNQYKKYYSEILKKVNNRFLKKSNDSVCKYCEYKRICIDPRYPTIKIINGKETLKHRKECSYNPFIGKWAYENDFKSLNESINNPKSR